MSIQVIKSGVLDTLQDKGRFGFAKWGVNTNGAMDFYAMQMANALVGNELNEAAIELHFPCGEYLFKRNALISITGADFDATIDEITVSCWKSLVVREGSVLSFKKRKNGARAYVAIQGGFALQQWLGSLSTNVRIEASGFILKKDAAVPLNPASNFGALLNDRIVFEFPWSVNYSSAYANPQTVSAIPGNEWDWLTDNSKGDFFSQQFEIGLSSDRMAYQLRAQPLEYKHRQDLISSGVAFGTIQGLPNGNALVLMADHQTTGGYPRIAHVATAHLPKLSQLSPNQKISFNKITVGEAEKMLFSLNGEIRMVQENCKHKLHRHHAIY